MCTDDVHSLQYQSVEKLWPSCFSQLFAVLAEADGYTTSARHLGGATVICNSFRTDEMAGPDNHFLRDQECFLQTLCRKMHWLLGTDNYQSLSRCLPEIGLRTR